jgi:hypothetical protein
MKMMNNKNKKTQTALTMTNNANEILTNENGNDTKPQQSINKNKNNSKKFSFKNNELQYLKLAATNLNNDYEKYKFLIDEKKAKDKKFFVRGVDDDFLNQFLLNIKFRESLKNVKKIGDIKLRTLNELFGKNEAQEFLRSELIENPPQNLLNVNEINYEGAAMKNRLNDCFAICAFQLLFHLKPFVQLLLQESNTRSDWDNFLHNLFKQSLRENVVSVAKIDELLNGNKIYITNGEIKQSCALEFLEFVIDKIDEKYLRLFAIDGFVNNLSPISYKIEPSKFADEKALKEAIKTYLINYCNVKEFGERYFSNCLLLKVDRVTITYQRDYTHVKVPEKIKFETKKYKLSTIICKYGEH